MPISKAERRVLQAVEAGAVTRKYSNRGNTFVGAGVAILRRMEAAGFIADGAWQPGGGILYSLCKVELTQAGSEALGAR